MKYQYYLLINQTSKVRLYNEGIIKVLILNSVINFKKTNAGTGGQYLDKRLSTQYSYLRKVGDGGTGSVSDVTYDVAIKGCYRHPIDAVRVFSVRFMTLCYHCLHRGQYMLDTVNFDFNLCFFT